jgi:hypothetical protein
MAVPAEARIRIDASGIPEDGGSAPERAPLEEQSPAVADMPRCPNCGWQTIRRSQKRTPLDFALSAFSLAPFRCRSCNSRFYRFYKQPKEQ